MEKSIATKELEFWKEKFLLFNDEARESIVSAQQIAKGMDPV
jgi:hypothetical protein